MPSFVVTTPTNTMTLDATRTGKIPVTVSNISGRPLRVRLNLVPTPPMESSWLSVEGEAEKELANGVSDQFTAVLTIPATAPGGTYVFKPVASAEDRPMEEFTEGQAVSAKVAEAKPATKFPWWLVAAAVGVAVLAVVLVNLIAGGGDDDAQQVTANATSTAPGSATSTTTTSTTAVTVTTLPVMVQVPGVVGKTPAAAKAAIEEVGLRANFVDNNLSAMCDPRVDSQFPVGGQMAVSDSEVDLSVPEKNTALNCLDTE